MEGRKKKPIAVIFGTFDRKWPVTKYIINQLSNKYDIIDISLSDKIENLITKFSFIMTYETKRIVYNISLYFTALSSLRGKKVTLFYVGFGGWESVFWAKKLSQTFGGKVHFHAIISRTNTNELYKHQFISKQRLMKKEISQLQSADIIIYDTPKSAEYYQRYLNIDITNKVRILPLMPDPEVFYPSSFPEIVDELRVVWWGSLSKVHHIEIVLEAIKICQGKDIKFTLITHTNVEVVLGLKSDQMMADLLGCNVHLIPWNYYDRGLSVEQLNAIIRQHHISLGIFNNNQHLRYIWANKEIEALLLNRILITRGKRHTGYDYLNEYPLTVETSEELATLLIEIYESKKLPSFESDLRARYIFQYKERFNSIFS